MIKTPISLSLSLHNAIYMHSPDFHTGGCVSKAKGYKKRPGNTHLERGHKDRRRAAQL